MTTIKNFAQAGAYLGSKNDRPFAHNTRIVRMDDGGIAATYHGHKVVKFYDGSAIYSSCGWKTSTTKERLNWFLPEGFSIYQSKSIWHLIKRPSWERGWIFSDGVQITDDGSVLYALSFNKENAKETSKIVRTIKKYVDGFVTELLEMRMDKPSHGDCFYCLMKTEDGQSLGEATHNNDHILLHMEEAYYVPSLLMNASKKRDLSMMAKDGIARLWDKEAISEGQSSLVERDVRSSLTAYLKHILNIPA